MKKAEQMFHSWTTGVIRFRVLVLVLVLLVSGILGSQIRFLQFDTSNESFLHEDDPILLTYNEFRDQFGRDDMLILSIESDHIFSREFLLKLQALHEDLLENVPYVNEITSMVNARNTRGEGDVLLVDDLLVEIPEDPAELAALRERVLNNPLYKDQLISGDGRFTNLVLESDVYSAQEGEDDLLSGFEDDLSEGFDDESTTLESGKFLSDQENSEFVEAVREIA
jgi:predicted RND superfamily exporter protein